jgi:hypothetical protein
MVLLLVVTALLFLPVLFADFVRLDDNSHLFDNPHLRRMSVAGLAALWTKSYFNLYIPITYSVWWAGAMVASLFGPLRQAAWLFHALNLAVHLANAALVFGLVRSWLRLRMPEADARAVAGGATIPLLAALCFALHPVQVETVAWISELKGGLATLFGLLGLFWHYRRGRRFLAGACFVAAMLAKPAAIVFPSVVLLGDRILLGKGIRKSVVLPALYTLPLLPLVLLTKHLQPDTELDFIPTLSQRLVVAIDALAFYVAKVLAPFSLAVDYGRSPQYVLGHFPGWQIGLTALLFVLGVAAAVWALVRPRPSSPAGSWQALMACGWSIFLLSIAPVLGLMPFAFQDISTVADRYLYVPMLGVSLMAAGVLLRFAAFANSRRIAVAVLVVLGGLSFRQAIRWRSTESLFTHAVKVNPRSYLGYYSIGAEHLHAGNLDQSVVWLEQSLAINPDYLPASTDLGLVWAQKGDPAKAIDCYQGVLARKPSTVGTRARPVAAIHNNLGLQLLQVGREAEGVEHFREAVAIFPRSLNAHLNLGNVAFAEGRYLDAIAEYEIAQGLSPGSPAVEQRLERARQAAREPPSP